MPLRDYRRGSPVAKGSSGSPRLKRSIVAVIVIILILIAIGVTLHIKSESVAIPTDPATLCPTNRPPAEILVILLDVSDQFSEPQRLQIRNHLVRIRDGVARFGRVEVYTVDRLGHRVTEPVSNLCNPGTGAELSPIYQNPNLARKKWQAFATKLMNEVDRQISAPDAKASPIFEAIQATALRTFGRPEFDRVPKRLVIVSDLLQNMQGRLNMYDGVPSFESFKKTAYFSQIRADLQDVSVFIYYLVRADVVAQGRAHIRFWEAYFQSQGAVVESVDMVYGDK